MLPRPPRSTLTDTLCPSTMLFPSISAGGQPVGGPSWQAQVAWLPQQPTFVAGTIADNLRLARRDATDDDLWSALRDVALEERVRALASGDRKSTSMNSSH